MWNPVRGTRTLLTELRRRGVLRTAGLYAVGAWLSVQVAVAVFPVLLLPPWTLRALVIAAILGFPVAVVLAWAYDVTPNGLRRADAAGASSDGAPTQVPAWMRLTLVVLVVAGSAGVGWWSWTGWLTPRAEAVSRPGADAVQLDRSHVAVLPFNDLTPGGELEHLALGLTDRLIHELTQIPALDVVSLRGVQPFGASTLALDSIARRLEAGTLVDGSVERTADGLVATVQLVDGASSTQLISRRIRARGTDPVALKDTIVAEAARQLGRRLGQELQLRDLRDDTDSPVAWDHFYRAREGTRGYDFLRWSLGDAGAARRVLERADSLLARAEAADPNWLRPVLLRGEVAARRAKVDAATRDANDPRLLQIGLGHAARALDRQPDHPEALALRGRVQYDLSWTVGAAEGDSLRQAAQADLKRAVELDRSQAEAWVHLAQVLRTQGDFSGASFAAHRAVEADPFLINAEKEILLAQAQVWLELEEIERAREWVATGRRRYPAEPSFAAMELIILAGGSAPRGVIAVADTAWQLVRTLESQLGVDRWRHGRLQVAAVLAHAGLADSARNVISSLGVPGPADPWAHYYEALVRLHLGERTQTLELLTEFLRLRPQRKEYVAGEWWWASLHGDAGFRRLVDLE